MIIIKDGNLFIVKIYKENINDIDIYDTDKILELFKSFLVILKDKYKISGLCDINVYINDDYGMILEINNLYKYDDEIDIKISFHIDALFMIEINFDIDNYDDYDEIYFYNNKYYTNYKNIYDSSVIYKDSLEIINSGIRIK